MSNRLGRAVGCLLAWVAWLWSPDVAALTKTTLSNGLTVIVQREGRAPRVGIAVAYRAGTRDDPRGRRGLAHVIEHVMFDEANEGAGYARVLDAAGASVINASVGLDHTIFVTELPARAYRTGLWVEAHRMAYVLTTTTDEQVGRVLRVVADEEALRRGHGAGFGFLALRELLVPPSHPYALLFRSPIGKRRLLAQDLDAIGLDEVAWGHQRFFRPSNATLALVGDVDEQEAIAEVTRHFGPIRAVGPDPRPPTEVLGPRTAERRGIVDEPGRASRLIMGWIAPPSGSLELAALSVVDAYLDGPFGPVQTELVETVAEVSEASVVLSQSELASFFSIDVTLTGAADPREVFPRVDALVDRIRRPLPAAVVEAAKGRVAVRIARWLEQPLARAKYLARHGESIEDFGRRVAQVDPRAVSEVGGRWLAPQARALLLVEPAVTRQSAGELVPGWR